MPRLIWSWCPRCELPVCLHRQLRLVQPSIGAAAAASSKRTSPPTFRYEDSPRATIKSPGEQQFGSIS